MQSSPRTARTLVIAGLIAMVGGALDPMEGAVIILVGTALAAAGTALSRSHHERWLYASLCLTATGVAALFLLSGMGGFGGTSGRSWWWGVLILPYPVGWLLGLFAATRKLREGFSAPPPA
jgi:hypothetical protein